MTEFDKKLEYAKVWLMLTNPFYGNLIAETEIKESITKKGKGYKDNKKRTCWTDGRKIWVDSEFAESITKEEFAGLLIHEVLHVAFIHPERCKTQSKIPVLYNIAADYVINLIIDKDYNKQKDRICLPDGGLLDHKYENMTTEQVYEILYKEAKDQGKILNVTMKCPCNGEGNEGDGGNGSYEDAIPDSVGKDYVPDIDWDSSKMSKEEIDEVKERLAKAAHVAKTQGKLPAGVEREIGDILRAKVDWRLVLRDFLQSYPNDWDFVERDRRFLNTPFYLPSFRGDKLKIVVAIDTSGSISQKEIDEFLSETYSIIQQYSTIEMILISCDAEVANVETITSIDDLKKYKVKGFGGTDFRPVFKYVDNNCENVYGLIYFTDGYGDFPSEEPDQLKTLWIMTTDVEPPFGRLIKYECDVEV